MSDTKGELKRYSIHLTGGLRAGCGQVTTEDESGHWVTHRAAAFVIESQAAELRDLRFQNESWQRAYDLGMVRARPPWWRTWFRA